MRAFWGWILCAASCTVLVVGAVLPRRDSVPASSEPAGRGGAWEEIARSEELGGQAEAIVMRRSARRAVAADVIAGLTTLEQATERFLELNRLHPECTTALRLSNPGTSDAECARRQVLEHVESARQEAAAETAARTGYRRSADTPANQRTRADALGARVSP